MICSILVIKQDYEYSMGNVSIQLFTIRINSRRVLKIISSQLFSRLIDLLKHRVILMSIILYSINSIQVEANRCRRKTIGSCNATIRDALNNSYSAIDGAVSAYCNASLPPVPPASGTGTNRLAVICACCRQNYNCLC